MKLDSVPASSPISGPHLFSAAMGSLKLHPSSPFWSFPPTSRPLCSGRGPHSAEVLTRSQAGGDEDALAMLALVQLLNCRLLSATTGLCTGSWCSHCLDCSSSQLHC